MLTATPQQEFRWEAAAASGRRRGPSQEERVLARLRQSAGQWVSMPALAAASGAYAVHSRISDLRRRGYQVEHRNHWADGICCSEYRLLTR